jgi:DNA-binding CsgD family transcriptional regulator
MSSTIEKNKQKNRSHQGSSPSSSLTTATSTTQTFDRKQVDSSRREQEAKRTKRRPTKVGLNDTLRRIRYLIVEGWSNSEIQDILQLNERTFYRYMAKIYEIDQALFAEQEKKTLVTEAGIFKDRLLRSYRWFMAIADNENMKPEIRMQAQNTALNVAVEVLKSELEGPRVIRKQGSLENIL